MSLFRSLVDPKVVRILEALQNRDIVHITELSTTSGVPVATTFRIVKLLVEKEILARTMIGKTKLYRLNPEKSDELQDLLEGTA